jgi:hypothetical protein
MVLQPQRDSKQERKYEERKMVLAEFFRRQSLGAVTKVLSVSKLGGLFQRE